MDGPASHSHAGPPLSQSVGYGIVLGLGFAFALGMMLTTYVLRRYNNEVQTSEMFSTAGRSVKSGLVASAVVSSWTWAATLLQSSGVAYRYGVSGPYWYAAGATVQILLFAALAIELKRRAPNAHTFLEVIRARYGTAVHLVFVAFALLTNVLVTAMLLTGGSAVVTSLTGMPTPAACFLLPVGVVLYTVMGGIKATFLTDYVHTVVILVVILVFSFAAYAANEVLGSPGRVFELLVEAAQRHPVEGNAEGSYLTMRSREGAIFFVINIVGNFGTVFMDVRYYNKAIAAHPVHALPGYVLGGLSWFAIPWLCATTMGLACLALESSPIFPTYPDRMSLQDVNAGLVLPNAAVALLGRGGAAATLLLVFMAVTSASSAELIAVSSIGTYDIYATYINPSASGRRLIWTAHACVVGYATAIAALSTGLYYAGISMGYLYLLMGVLVSSAVLPAALTLLWSGQSALAAGAAPVLGLACSLAAWLGTARALYDGVLDVETTGANMPMLAGNVVALLSPALFIPLLTWLGPGGPQRYDWKSMAEIRLADDADKGIGTVTVVPTAVAGDGGDVEAPPVAQADNTQVTPLAADAKTLSRAALIARSLTVCLTLALLVVWPMPLYGSSYVFSRQFFTGWVVVGFIWLFCSTACVGVYPLWEGRKSMARCFSMLAGDLFGGGGKKGSGSAAVEDGGVGSGEESPVESKVEEVRVEGKV